MHNQKFERILQGHHDPLTQSEFLQFQAHCSALNLSLQQWIQASKTIFKENPQQSYQLLTYLARNQLQKAAFNDVVQHGAQKIKIYNSLTGMVLTKASRSANKDQADKLLNQARKLLNSSQKVRMTVDTSIILNRAFLHYYDGEVTKALNFVNRTYQQILKTGQGKSLMVTCLLVMAQINFLKKNYAKSLDLYKKILQTTKQLPIKARLGMAYSFYYLGKFQMARACFQRVIRLNPQNAQGYIGVAVVYEKQQNYQQYFGYLKLAYKVNQKHPLVLLHLAQHFTLRGQLQKATGLSQRGLLALQQYPKFFKSQEGIRNDYEQLKGRFNNILGQINHMNGNYTQAIKYYTLASGKDMIWNEIGLAQAYINPLSQNYLQAIRLLDQVYKTLQGKDTRIVNDTYRLMAYLKSKIPPRGQQQRGAEYYYTQAIKFNRQDFEAKIQFTNILVQSNKSKALKQLVQAAKIYQQGGNRLKAELQNNIAVLQLDQGHIQSSSRRLSRCLTMVQQIHPQGEQQQVRKQSLRVLVRFNYGIVLQKQMKWQSAAKIYRQIIAINKYHLDSYSRLANCYARLGDVAQVGLVFEQAQGLCNQAKNKLIRPQRFYHSKAYIQHQLGSNHQAKETLKLLGRNKDIYTQLFELCLNYQNIMRKGVQLSTLKQFLRPNRQFCFKYCSEDHHATFGYMLFVIILLVDKKFTKNQGVEFFNNLKQFSADDIPSILYNMGIFLLSYDDYQNSINILSFFKDKAGPNVNADQLISLNYLLQNDYKQSQAWIKRNIMRDPTNLRYRWQYAYAAQRQCLRYYQKGEFSMGQVRKSIDKLHLCMRIHNFFSKCNMLDQLKWVQVPQVKQRLRSIYMKIKGLAQQRKFYIKSYLDSYQKVVRELQASHRQQMERQRLAREKEKNRLKELELRKLLDEGEEESEDQEEKLKKEEQKKRQRVIELARKRQAQLDVAYSQLKQQQKNEEEQKKTRKRNAGQPKQKRQKKEKNKEREQSDEDLPQQSQEQFQQPVSMGESEPQVEAVRKDKEKKKKKKKHIHMSSEGEDNEQEQEEVRNVVNSKEDEEMDELKKYMID